MPSALSGATTYDVLTDLPEVLRQDLQPELVRFHRLLQVRDEVTENLAFPLQLCRFDDDLCREVSTVIEEVVFPHGRVTGGLDGQRRVGRLFQVQTFCLDDNIIISAFEPAVFSS